MFGSIRRAAALVAVVLLAGSALVVAGTTAAGAATCTLAPQLRDITINQGLGSYTPLAAGKTTLVRAYLSLPSCAGTGAAIEVRGGSISVAVPGGATTPVGPTPVPTAPYAQVATYKTAPATDSPADLKFAVPGAALTNSTGTAFTASFTVTVSYGARSSSTTAFGSTVTTSFAATTASVAAQTNNLRVLVVPIGDPSDTTRVQYPPDAATAVQNGMQALSRLYPVRDGVGDLTVAGNGIRYTALTSLLDVGPNGLRLMTAGGNFCIKGSTWSVLKGALAQQREAWNSANPTAQADRVVGVVWQGISGDATTGCNDGLSTISSPEAVIRLVPDGATPSTTGALFAHELEHTMGGEPQPPADTSYHSVNRAADGTSPNRDYNVTTRQFLGTSDLSVMHSGSAADNIDGLLEPTDYAVVQCTLTPGATTGCPAPGSAGVAANGPALVLSGSTDGTVAGTTIESYFDGDIERTQADPTSPYHLLQFDATNAIVSDVRIPARQIEPNETGGGTSTSPRAAIDVAISVDPNAEAFAVTKDGAGTLYARARDGAPAFQSVGRGLTVRTLADYTNVAGDDTQPALTSDGSLVAWVDASGVRVRRADKSAPASAAGALPGSEPSFSQTPDSSGKWHLLYTQAGGAIHTVTVDLSSGTPVFTGDTTVYNANVLGLGNAPGHHASYNADGTVVIVAINGDIWRLNLGAPFTPSNPLVCALSPLLGNGCTRIIATSANEANPSVSPSNVIAYEHDADVWTAALDGSSQAASVTGASNPAWGGGVLAFDQGGNVVAKDLDGSMRTLTTGGADNWPALDGGATTLALDRLTGGQHDVFLGTVDRRAATAVVTDDHPGNLRLDVYVRCGTALYPVQINVAPTSTTSTTGSFNVDVDPTTVCAGGTLVLKVNDGWQTVQTDDGSTGAPHDPVGAIYSPPPSSSWLQFDAIPVSGLGLDAEDNTLPDARLAWSQSGPGVANHAIGTGRSLPDLQPPTGGWAPGAWTITLTVTDSSGRTSSRSVTYTVLQDADHDGIPASKDVTCGGTSADNDPTNANADYDADGIPNRDDPAPCTSANNATINFDPDSLNTGSSGTPVTVYITFNGGDLNTVAPATVKIVQIANLPANITAFSWSVTGTHTAVAQFDRATVNNFIIQNQLKGSYVPFVIQGSSSTFTFRGVDPSSPVTS